MPLIPSHASQQGSQNKTYGVVVGLVTDNKDPDKLGRVKVKFPWLSETVVSWWARIAFPMAGKERGFWWIPEIDDEVLVAFEQGDVRFPYVIGALYNGVDTPPQIDNISNTFGGEGYDHGGHSGGGRDFNEDGNNDLRFIRSRSGHMIVLDDKDGKERVVVTDNTGKHRVEIHTADKRLVITSEDGDIELIAKENVLIRCNKLITESRDNTEINVDGEMITKVKKDIKIESEMNIVRDAKMKITETAKMDSTYESKMNMNVKGGINVAVEASVQFTVKGVTGEVNGSAMLDLKGGLVKIN